MKKSVIEAVASKARGAQEWLDLEQLANAEVTSEDPEYPIESVFGSAPGAGWRAAEGGRQTIRLLFSEPQSIHQIHLEFLEVQVTRLQEFTLKWVSAADKNSTEIVRQQWNFSPQGSTSEVEDYQVSLSGVLILELILNPDLSGGAAVASLARWQVA